MKNLIIQGGLKKSDNTEPHLTPQEMERLLVVAPTDLRIFFLFAFRSGCRLGEVIGLHHTDIKGHTAKIQRTVNLGRVGTTKNGKSRVVDLSPQLVEELKLLPKNGNIVFSRNGKLPV